MERIKVGTSRTYEIHIEEGLLDHVAEECSAVLKSEKLLLLTDSNVQPLYGDAVCRSLTDAGYQVIEYVIPAGEESKNTEQYLKVVSTLAKEGFSRSDAIVALGGGVVGDLAGFCASSYLRGIPFVQIPTTLLACVDSSVGGKTAVNLPEGKNLLGAFYQPRLVLIDPLVLKTLTPAVYADGMAEVIKYGMIRDEELFDALENHVWTDTQIITRCVTIKSRVVAEDEFDNGCRLLLNYGHTVGHAIEQCSHFEISHGSAVAIGMAVMARAEEGGAPLADRLDVVLKDYGLPTACAFSPDELYRAAMADKKRRNQTLHVITVPSLGNGTVVTIPVEELRGYLQRGLSQ
ncbi:MAG: 3-dehydroquinate synthase [Clostridia bacterium]|nr:3-dehydroquinate synthase [Clostridia bacterium]